MREKIVEILCCDCEYHGKCEDAPYGGGLLGLDCKRKRDAFIETLEALLTARTQAYRDALQEAEKVFGRFAEGCSFPADALQRAIRDESRKALAKIEAVLKGEVAPVKYGCHCDLDEGQEPGSCVFDTGEISDCVEAEILQKQGKGRLCCKYWKAVLKEESNG